MSFLKKLLDSEFKELKRFDKMADEILALDEQMSKLEDIDFKNKTEEFKERLKIKFKVPVFFIMGTQFHKHENNHDIIALLPEFDSF